MADTFSLIGSEIRVGNVLSASSSVYTFDAGKDTLTIRDNTPDTHVHVEGNLSCKDLFVNDRNITQSIDQVHVSTTRYYVKTTGDNSQDGRSWDRAFQTIEHAAQVATSAANPSVIYVEAGDYLENTPIVLGPRISVMGDNLRLVRVYSRTPRRHFFLVNNLCYIYGIRFMDLQEPAFCVSFPCSMASVTLQSGGVSSVDVLYSCSGYLVPPQIRIETPESKGQQPTADATIDTLGQVSGIGVTFQGDPFSVSEVPSVHITRPDLSTGLTPVLTPSIINTQLSDIQITPGTRYLATPTITVQPPSSGTTAKARAVLDQQGYLVDVIIDIPGNGYNSGNPPNVSIDAPLAIPCTARVQMDSITQFGQTYARVGSIILIEKGSGYSTPPIVTIDAPEPITATAEATISGGLITEITVTHPGTGYTNLISRPRVSIPPPDIQKPVITGSPYIQNCSSISGPFDTSGNKVTNYVLPYDTADIDTTGACGGCLIDGALVADGSPLKSMCADSFTLVNQGGSGHLVLNTGYGQFVSCFTTFCSFSYRASEGGTMNISTSVSDFGTYGLVSSGYWPEPIATAKFSQVYRSQVADVVVTNVGAGYDNSTTAQFSSGTATASVTVENQQIASVSVINPGSYEAAPEITFQGVGAGASASVVLQSPEIVRIKDANGRKPELGTVMKHRGTWHTVIRSTFVQIKEYDIVFDPPIIAANLNEPIEFFGASVVSTGQHVMEHVGAGTTLNALPVYGGVRVEANYIVQNSPARVFYCITDHLGNQQVGPYFSVEQLSGKISLNSTQFSLSGLQSIGPFKRQGIAVGVELEEVSNDTRLIDSTGSAGGGTVPTQYAVKEYTKTQISALQGKILTSVKDFGAIGNGVADDTSAIQAALDSSTHVFFPIGTYRVTAQIEYSKSGSCLYGPESSSQNGARIKFEHDGICFNCIEYSPRIYNLIIEGPRSGNDIALRVMRTVNTDDVDVYVTGCTIFYCTLGLQIVGRSINALRNVFANNTTCMSLEWPTSGVNASAPEQGLPLGWRATRISNNRVHSCGLFIETTGSNTEYFRGALITNNQLDIGERLFSGGIINSVIADNIVEMANSTIIYITGGGSGLIIDSNILGGTSGDYAQSPARCITFETGTNIYSTTISNNRFAYTDTDAILVKADSICLTIRGNSFEEVGLTVGSAACIRIDTTNTTSLLVDGNSYNPNPGYRGLVLNTSLNSSIISNNVAASGVNLVDYGTSYNDSGANQIKDSPTHEMSSAIRTFGIGSQTNITLSANGTTIPNLSTQDIVLTSPNGTQIRLFAKDDGTLGITQL